LRREKEDAEIGKQDLSLFQSTCSLISDHLRHREIPPRSFTFPLNRRAQNRALPEIWCGLTYSSDCVFGMRKSWSKS
jgi:hypothetical protein